MDHNTYLSERKIGSQTDSNFNEVIGETNVKKAIAGLISDGYRQQNADNCTDLRFDVLEDETAPEGFLWIVQAGAYKSLNNAKKLQRRLEKMGVVSLIKKYEIS